MAENVEMPPVVRLADNTMYPTVGSENRFSNVLFIEKEGFDSLWRAAQISERFDMALMSTKGLSVGAARMLIDGLAGSGVRVFVLHDFDLSGFKIFGTLGTDSRIYTFKNRVEIIDLGLRLEDVERLDLTSEPVKIEGDWDAHSDTLERHGATEDEIDFLETERVELNMLSAPQFVEFLEDKFAEYDVEKLVPSEEVIEAHARRIIEQDLAQKVIEKALPKIQRQAAAESLPSNMAELVQTMLGMEPTMSWDAAVGEIVRAS